MNITLNGANAPIVLRVEKNSELTFEELDGNFQNLALKTMENDDAVDALTKVVDTKATTDAVNAIDKKVDTKASTDSVTAVEKKVTTLTEVVDKKSSTDAVTAVDSKVDALRKELVDAGVLKS